MTNTYLILSIVVAIIAIALGAAYSTGALDPVIEKIGIMVFKAEAKAEEKKLEAQGLKEGEDFLEGEFLFSVLVWIGEMGEGGGQEDWANGGVCRSIEGKSTCGWC